MNRRAFLKVLSAPALMGALPALSLVPVSRIPAVAEAEIGLVREVAAYDINLDMFVIRHDILTDDDQWHVTQEIGSSLLPVELEKARSLALLLLGNQLTHVGKSWSDLKYLPLPGYCNYAKHIAPARTAGNIRGVIHA